MISYKHHITVFLQALLLSLAFASCIKDDFSSDIAGTDGSGTPFYLTLQLEFNENSSSTRATETKDDNLEFGDHFEHVIGLDDNLIVLFKDDKLFGVFSLTALTGHEHNTEDGRGDNGSNKDNGLDDNIEARNTYSAKFPAEDESQLPNSCLVVMNCSESVKEKLEAFNEKKENTKVKDILKVLWNGNGSETSPEDIGYSASDHKYFTMTNSIYYDENNKLQANTEIPEGYITKSLMNAKHITVYVERMVAKFSFKEQDNTKTYYELDTNTEEVRMFNGYNADNADETDPGDPGTLLAEDITSTCQIIIKGWGINAIERNTYLFKNIGAGTDEYKTNWNNAANYRYHWSIDPHYYENDGAYPWQYRPAVEKDVPYYSDKDNLSPLKNYSYDDFVDEKDNHVGEGLGRYIYVPENTYGQDIINADLDSRNNLLAGTHLIICAEIKTDFTGDELNHECYQEYKNDEGPQLHNLYRDNTNIYYTTQKLCFAELVRRFNNDLKSNSAMRFHYYKWDGNDGVDNCDKTEHTNPNNGEEFFAKTEGNYRLYRNGLPFTYKEANELSDVELGIATILNGDGRLLPWLDGEWEIKDIDKEYNDPENELLIYGDDYDFVQDELWQKTGGEMGKPYNTKHCVTSNDIKSLMLEWMGAIDHFKDGKMYYAAPVSHHRTKNANEDKDEELGDYGVLRNNWYIFNLEDITHVGTPVDKPEDPIVPNKVDTHDKLKFSIDLLDWHKVGTSVTLPK